MIVYTIDEKDVNGYVKTVDGFTITNSHKTALIDITGTKTWNDQNNQDGIRPDSIDLTLYANGIEVEGAKPTWVKTGDVWTYTYKSLDQSANGTAIVYSITEAPIEGYTAFIDGLNITNVHTTAVTTVYGTKNWVDESDADKVRPDAITLILYGNGQELGNINPIWTKNGNTWTYTIDNLPLNLNGKAVEYTIEEVPVNGYTTAIDGFTITNTHKVDAKLPNTGVDNTRELLFAAMALLSGLIIVLGTKKATLKRKN